MKVNITGIYSASASIKNVKNVSTDTYVRVTSNPFAMATDSEEVSRYCARKAENGCFSVSIDVVDKEQGINITASLSTLGDGFYLTTIEGEQVNRVPLQNDDGTWFGLARAIRTTQKAAMDLVAAKF